MNAIKKNNYEEAEKYVSMPDLVKHTQINGSLKDIVKKCLSSISKFDQFRIEEGNGISFKYNGGNIKRVLFKPPRYKEVELKLSTTFILTVDKIKDTWKVIDLEEKEESE